MRVFYINVDNDIWKLNIHVNATIILIPISKYDKIMGCLLLKTQRKVNTVYAFVFQTVEYLIFHGYYNDNQIKQEYEIKSGVYYGQPISEQYYIIPQLLLAQTYKSPIIVDWTQFTTFYVFVWDSNVFKNYHSTRLLLEDRLPVQYIQNLPSPADLFDIKLILHYLTLALNHQSSVWETFIVLERQRLKAYNNKEAIDVHCYNLRNTPIISFENIYLRQMADECIYILSTKKLCLP